jgi:hypothetical protein
VNPGGTQGILVELTELGYSIISRSDLTLGSQVIWGPERLNVDLLGSCHRVAESRTQTTIYRLSLTQVWFGRPCNLFDGMTFEPGTLIRPYQT